MTDDDRHLRAEPQQARSRATLERILEAANIEFALNDYNRVRTTAIADRAGVSVGSLYRFFPDKHHVALELVAQYRQDIETRYGEMLSSVNERSDVPGALRDMVHGAVDLQNRHPGYYRLTEEQPANSEGSYAYPVRSGLIDIFDDLLEHVGSALPKHRRRIMIDFCIETVRHTLARLPTDQNERAVVLDALEAMIVGYAERELK